MSSDDIKIVAQSRLPTRHGDFTLVAFSDFEDAQDHVALVRGDIKGRDDVLVRVHSECLTGDAFGSLRCDCGEQLDAALAMISKDGAGVLLYLRQEGRGIGLRNKIRAYALQDQGLDTVEANLRLGFNADARGYGPGAEMLKALEVGPSIRLLTNNLDKVEGLEALGYRITRVPLIIPANESNRAYLRAKAAKMRHQL